MTQIKLNNISAQTERALKVTQAHLSHLPNSVKILRQRTHQALNSVFTRFFKDADAQMFRLANEAFTQADRDALLAAMSTVRSNQKIIKACFFEQQDLVYAQLNVPPQTTVTQSLDNIKVAELSLVGYDDLDQIVATQAIVSNALRTHEPLLQEISARINTAVLANTKAESLPTAPGVLTDCFTKAIHMIELRATAAHVIFKLYEKTFIARLPELYRMQQQLLVEHGVAIDQAVKPVTLKPGNSTQAKVRSVKKPQKLKTPVAASSAHKTPAKHATPAQPKTLKTPAGPNKASLVKTQQLASQKSALPGILEQLRKLSAADTLSLNETNLPLQALIEKALPKAPQRLPQRSASFVDFIGKLFEQLQKNTPLSLTAQTVLSSMQLPLASLMLQDKEFLRNSKHAARLLLNELCAALFSLDTQNSAQLRRDPLFKKIQRLVRSFSQIAQPREADFKQALEELSALRRKEEQRIQIIEKRMRGNEVGRLQSDYAHRLVEQTILEVTAGTQLLDATKNLIEQAWKPVLLFTALSKGEASPQWRKSVETLVDLVSMRDTRRKADKVKLNGVKIELIQALESINFDSFKTEELIAQFEEFIAAPSHRPRDASPSSINPELVLKVVSAKLNRNRQAPYLARGPQAIDKKLKRGTWFAISTDGSTRIGRLAAVIEAYDSYIFTNGQGKKLFSFTKAELTDKLGKAQLKVLDTRNLFDRALSQVIKQVKNKDKKA